MATESMRRHAGSPRPQPGSDEKPHEVESRPCGSVLRAALADELVAAAVSLRDMLAGAHLDESIDKRISFGIVTSYTFAYLDQCFWIACSTIFYPSFIWIHI